MSINATRSEGNTDRMNGYLEGYASGQKCGSEIMKMKACREFSKIIAEICPHFTKDDIDALENVFRKRLEE
jgi:hypothetical protein